MSHYLSPSGEVLWEQTLSGQGWEEIYQTSYLVPGFTPFSLSWLPDAKVLMVLGRDTNAQRTYPSSAGKSAYSVLFIDQNGRVINLQELGYILPYSDFFERSKVVVNQEINQAYLFAKLDQGQRKNSLWLISASIDLKYQFT